MLRNIPSAALKQLLKLVEQKEALMARIQEIDREMLRVQDRFGIPARDADQGAPVTVSRAPRQRTIRQRTKRSALKGN